MDLNNNNSIQVLEQQTSIQSNQVSVIVFASPHSSSSLNQTNSTKKKKKNPVSIYQPPYDNRVEIIIIDDDDSELDSNQTKLVPHAALSMPDNQRSLPNQLEPPLPPILPDSIIDYQKFDNGIEIITIDDSDDDDDNIETNIEETLKSISIQQKNYNSTSDELIEVNHIGGDDIVAPEANVAVEVVVSLVTETSSISLDFESVGNQNNTKFTSKGNSKLRNNNNKRIESNEERQQRLEQCREFYGLRKRKQEEEPRNSQASSELYRVGQNGKLRSNRDIDNSTDIDIDNRATLKSSGRRSDGGGGCGRRWKLLKISETPEHREHRLAKMREWRANETAEQREHRLTLQREYDKQRLANETPEQRDRRLTLQKEYHKQRLANETPEQRDRRLTLQKEYHKQRLANETPEEREIRLAKKLESYHRNKQQQQHSSTRKSNNNN